MSLVGLMLTIKTKNRNVKKWIEGGLDLNMCRAFLLQHGYREFAPVTPPYSSLRSRTLLTFTR